MLKKILLIIIFLLFLPFVLASTVDVTPSAKTNEDLTITVNPDAMGVNKFYYIYQEFVNSSDILRSISTFPYPDDIGYTEETVLYGVSSGWGTGDYYVSVYSYSITDWIKKYFDVTQVICYDVSLGFQFSVPNLECSSSKPKYCDDGELIHNCQICGCPSDVECQASGVCLNIPEVGQNTKSMSKYSNQETFLISNWDWKNVLQYIPVTTWTGNEGCSKGYGTPDNVCVYPTLIYHRESYSKYDIDSIIYFMQLYEPSKVALIQPPEVGTYRLEELLIANPGLGAGIAKENIQRTYTYNDYFSYWETFDTIVYVEDDYELALLASTYASLLNAPLVIKDANLDLHEIFVGRNVICVGSVSPAGSSCSEQYTLETLRQKYKSKTGTNKAILINPTDWDTGVVRGSFPTDKALTIGKLYTKTSLMAPILASAKHELLISTTKTDKDKIDNYIQPSLSGISYLTIMASEKSIPQRAFMETRGTMKLYWALDQSLYADTNGDHKPEIAAGRIAGISSSDISSYIARVLFFDRFRKTNRVMFMASSFGGTMEFWVKNLMSAFKDLENSGYYIEEDMTAEESYDFDPKNWEDKELIFYVDHGWAYWQGIDYDEIPELKNSLVVTAACHGAETFTYSSFWAHSIRKGAIGFVGSVSITFWSVSLDWFLRNIYHKDYPTIGDAFKDSYSVDIDTSAMTTLIGDPTFDLNTKSPKCFDIGDFCWVNDNCCHRQQCELFTCNYCKEFEKGCFWDTDCCDDLPCKVATCGYQRKGQNCWFNEDCNPGLRCDGFMFWAECKDCRIYGEPCTWDTDCCGDEECKMSTCGLQRRYDKCAFDEDCEGDLKCTAGNCGCQERNSFCWSNSDCCSGLECKGFLWWATCKIKPKPKSGGGGGGGSCFSGDMNVLLENGIQKKMSDLKIGEKVLTFNPDGSTEYVEVYAFLDHAPNKIINYLVLETNHGELELTPDHLVFTKKAGVVYGARAMDLKVGGILLKVLDDTIVEATVLNIKEITKTGAYGPATRGSGTIAVNGFLASIYAASHPKGIYVPHSFINILFKPLSELTKVNDENITPQEGIHWYAEWLKEVFCPILPPGSHQCSNLK
ncbi:hypothetical protein CL621_02065 [archaeon]|nr:hypothetical protein [archaeon]|tara:strand:+ start:2772 stop:6047 length:3276 start_codon:yes stop_codon:yes gene_type:complete